MHDWKRQTGRRNRVIEIPGRSMRNRWRCSRTRSIVLLACSAASQASSLVISQIDCDLIYYVTLPSKRHIVRVPRALSRVLWGCLPCQAVYSHTLVESKRGERLSGPHVIIGTPRVDLFFCISRVCHWKFMGKPINVPEVAVGFILLHDLHD